MLSDWDLSLVHEIPRLCFLKIVPLKPAAGKSANCLGLKTISAKFNVEEVEENVIFKFTVEKRCFFQLPLRHFFAGEQKSSGTQNFQKSMEFTFSPGKLSQLHHQEKKTDNEMKALKEDLGGMVRHIDFKDAIIRRRKKKSSFDSTELLNLTP